MIAGEKVIVCKIRYTNKLSKNCITSYIGTNIYYFKNEGLYRELNFSVVGKLEILGSQQHGTQSFREGIVDGN